MSKTESDPLGRSFEWRLSNELNRVRPRWSSPRYLDATPHRVGAWRLAPAALVAAASSGETAQIKRPVRARVLVVDDELGRASCRERV